jgi:hypothetical protein
MPEERVSVRLDAADHTRDVIEVKGPGGA